MPASSEYSAAYLARVRADFDQIASFGGESGGDRYDDFLLTLVPQTAVDILEIGCGSGRLAAAVVNDSRHVAGIDLSPVMIERARREWSPRVAFVCGDFLEHDFGPAQYDCIVTAAALHHMPMESAIGRMTALLRSGGRLVIQDMRRDAGLVDSLRAKLAFGHHAFIRFVRTGHALRPPHVRAAWKRHCKDEHYLSWNEACDTAARLLPGAHVYYHWMWRYTIVWDKP